MSTRPERGHELARSNSKKRDFTGKTPDTALKDDTPESMGDAVVAEIGKSHLSRISACAIVNAAMSRFEADRTLLARFADVLVAANVIHRPFEANGRVSSKLSMLRKIGEHAEILRKPEIATYLSTTGYSGHFQAAHLYEDLGRDEAKFIEKLKAHAGRVTRDYLREQRDLIKASSDLGTAPGGLTPVPATSAATTSILRDGTTDFLLLTPSRADFDRLRKDYVEGEEPVRCMQLLDVVAEDAAAVVIAPLRELPVVAERLLPPCGFKKITHIYLTQRPEGMDLIGASAMITAERGQHEILKPLEGSWLDNGNLPTEPGVLAASLAPLAEKKLHVFAETPSEGWDCILESEAWATRKAGGDA